MPFRLKIMAEPTDPRGPPTESFAGMSDLSLSGRDDPGQDRGEKASVASISKAISILRLLGASRFPLTMTEISREAGLTPSSCHDLVTTLVQFHLVQPSSVGKSYELGARIVRLAKLSLAAQGDFEAVQHKMHEVASRYELHLAVHRRNVDLTRVTIHTAEGTAPIRIGVTPGLELPLFSGTPGPLFGALAGLDPSERAAALAGAGLTDAAAIARFDAACAVAMQDGWSADLGDSPRGVGSLSVPIRAQDGGLIGVLEILGFRSRLQAAPLAEILGDAHAIAQEIARVLD